MEGVTKDQPFLETRIEEGLGQGNEESENVNPPCLMGW
jgi:hypothetical protein